MKKGSFLVERVDGFSLATTNRSYHGGGFSVLPAQRQVNEPA
jgi:hypothetical protein